MVEKHVPVVMNCASLITEQEPINGAIKTDDRRAEIRFTGWIVASSESRAKDLREVWVTDLWSKHRHGIASRVDCVATPSKQSTRAVCWQSSKSSRLKNCSVQSAYHLIEEVYSKLLLNFLLFSCKLLT